jgi:hypothetical protein
MTVVSTPAVGDQDAPEASQQALRSFNAPFGLKKKESQSAPGQEHYILSICSLIPQSALASILFPLTPDFIL